MYAAGIIEREDGHVLIAAATDQAESSRLWQFPRCPVEPDETPESALRRFTAEEINMPVDIIECQPPLMCQMDGREIELRYLFCGPLSDEPIQGPFAEVRWVPKAHLREYDFDPASQPVADWILGANAG